MIIAVNKREIHCMMMYFVLLFFFWYIFYSLLAHGIFITIYVLPLAVFHTLFIIIESTSLVPIFYLSSFLFVSNNIGKLENCSRLQPSNLHDHITSKNYYNLSNNHLSNNIDRLNHTPYGSSSRNFDKKACGSPSDLDMDVVERRKDSEEYLSFDDPSGEYVDYSVFKDKVIHNKNKYGWEDSDSRRFTERRKKTVRFDGYDGSQTFPRAIGHHRDLLGSGREAHVVPNWATVRWECDRQGSQDSATKDSGIDTSSNFTSSEDSNRGDGPKVFKI